MSKMKAITLFVLALTLFNPIEGSYGASCKIKGLTDWDWRGYMTGSIGDSYEGLIATFETEKILELLSYESIYMHATFSDNILSIFTNERFKKFEEEYEAHYWYAPAVEIDIKFNCSDNKTDTLYLETEVTDDNTHDPVFSRDVYEYHFGMSIPENYDLTKIIPISATDKDFTNDYMYYTIEEFSDDLKLGYGVDGYYQDDENYFTSFKTLKELKAPFRKEFNIVSRDAGSPSRSSTARVIVSVTSNGDDGNESNESGEDGDASGSHPPVFAKHLYFANYTSKNDLQMEEAITIKYGARTDTTIKQSGYDEYFKIALNPKKKGLVDVTILESLPETILESTSFLVVEIEAENADLHMPGRTALIIHLPTIGEQSSGSCGVTEIWGSNNTLTLVFCLTSILMITVMNIVVLIWFFQRKKIMAELAPMPPAVNPMFDIPNLEKVRI